MMKYRTEHTNTVSAEYGKEQGNPFLEALPELLGKAEFVERMKSEIHFPYDLPERSPQERRNYLTELTTWFQPMDYMYNLYDMLYRAMSATYQTKTVVESVRQLNEIYMDFRTGRERTLNYSTQAYSGAVLGVPGIGKTSTIQRCLSTMPQVIIHTKYQDKQFYTKQINYLVVECPSDCSVKTLAFNILSAIDRAIGSEYFTQAGSLKSISSSALTTRLKIICMNHHIGLIVIDEIQNAIQTAARNKQTRPLIKFLVELTNETSTGICFCGTLEAEELFMKQEHLKRRTRGLRLLPMKFDMTYRKFISSLWEYQATLQKAELTEKLMKQIYDLSAGIPAYIVKIVQEAQAQAILSGREKITYESIKQAVSYLGIEVPKVYSRGGTSISDFTVQEIEFETIGVDDMDGSEIEIECSVVEESKVITLPVVLEAKQTEETVIQPQEESETLTESTTEPVKRFYASKRGRKHRERDKADLVSIWKQNESAEYLIQTLGTYQMIERRCY
ncbi:transposase [Clostridium sp. AF18-27]|uniref:AAA family ATPase n=1 Tax=Enterocloster lavalensis TaxID=460384 RepID=UPI000E4A1CC9|nr:AAA family ATPase [Enterocloster lavalensis]RHR44647.1 transposase [Clostridium sp. AF18-27]